MKEVNLTPMEISQLLRLIDQEIERIHQIPNESFNYISEKTGWITLLHEIKDKLNG